MNEQCRNKCAHDSSSTAHISHILEIGIFLLIRFSLVADLPRKHCHKKKFLFVGMLLIQMFLLGKLEFGFEDQMIPELTDAS